MSLWPPLDDLVFELLQAPRSISHRSRSRPSPRSSRGNPTPATRQAVARTMGTTASAVRTTPHRPPGITFASAPISASTTSDERVNRRNLYWSSGGTPACRTTDPTVHVGRVLGIQQQLRAAAATA